MQQDQAIERLKSGDYAYYVDETGSWCVISENDLSLFVDCIQSRDPAIAKNPYKYWCQLARPRVASFAELYELGVDDTPYA